MLTFISQNSNDMNNNISVYNHMIRRNKCEVEDCSKDVNSSDIVSIMNLYTLVSSLGTVPGYQPPSPRRRLLVGLLDIGASGSRIASRPQRVARTRAPQLLRHLASQRQLVLVVILEETSRGPCGAGGHQGRRRRISASVYGVSA